MDDATGTLLPGSAFVSAADTVSSLRDPGGDLHGPPRHLPSQCLGVDDRGGTARGRQAPTPVGRALETLGSQPLYALSPQAKGRIERLWETLQDRLVSELRLAAIATVEAANAVLPYFTAQFNARFGRPAVDTVPAWRPLPPGLDPDRVCSLYTEATVLNDNTVRVDGAILQISPGPGGRGYAKVRVEVRQLLDGPWRVYSRDQLIATQVDGVGPPRRSLRRRTYGTRVHQRSDIFIEQLT